LRKLPAACLEPQKRGSSFFDQSLKERFDVKDVELLSGRAKAQHLDGRRGEDEDEVKRLISSSFPLFEPAIAM
jgi:hypothetical protein